MSLRWRAVDLSMLDPDRRRLRPWYAGEPVRFPLTGPLEDEGAVHHESAWAERLPEILRYLFPPR